jgi:hypothetical protein
MTATTTNRPQVGDLLMDYGDDVGVITLVDPVAPLYYVLWTSGALTGYTTAHSRYDVRRWKQNLEKKT